MPTNHRVRSGQSPAGVSNRRVETWRSSLRGPILPIRANKRAYPRAHLDAGAAGKGHAPKDQREGASGHDEPGSGPDQGGWDPVPRWGAPGARRLNGLVCALKRHLASLGPEDTAVYLDEVDIAWPAAVLEKF